MALLPFISIIAGESSHGFGAEGHRVAGLVAEAYLCGDAEREITELGGGPGLEELGLWADRIRGYDRWAHAEPWHYMNIPDDMPVERFRHPEEGDVLWATTHFLARWADRSLAPAQRGEALKFFTHFIVDLHQPLHVGRASDRGGNSIRVVVGASTTNLHRLWDTDVVQMDDLTTSAYAGVLLALAAPNASRWVGGRPLEWVQESQELRTQVYGFRPVGRSLGAEYLAMARSLTRRRLAQAGVRLAHELNRALCPEGPHPMESRR